MSSIVSGVCSRLVSNLLQAMLLGLRSHTKVNVLAAPDIGCYCVLNAIAELDAVGSTILSHFNIGRKVRPCTTIEMATTP